MNEPIESLHDRTVSIKVAAMLAKSTLNLLLLTIFS